MVSLIVLLIKFFTLAPVALTGLVMFAMGVWSKDWLGATIGLAAMVPPTIVLVKATTAFLKEKPSLKIQPTPPPAQTQLPIITQTEYSPTVFCTRCGAANTATANYCGECGNKLSKEDIQ